MDVLNSAVWVEATVMGHILAVTPSGRLVWLKKITEALALAKVLYSTGNIPMFFKNISADSQADFLKVGQVKAVLRYGIIPIPPQGEKINHAYLSADGM